MPTRPAQFASDGPAKTSASPYPGLRPFQEQDAEYFFGRKQQIDEIVARITANRFVAVIGGSGSGKSSLVLAGAIPRLRTSSLRRDSPFRDAGNFWVPIVATPGTNYRKEDRDSPIRRLARKFCGALRPMPDSESDAARIHHCEQLLREANGLGKLVDSYGRDLHDDDGVDLSLTVPADGSEPPRYLINVNFLFLIDQFEELFHPSNDVVKAECAHLVDRIVEQFKNKHPQVCIALTMRSEHLNDCPRYLELPDAINATAYLVKRLNPGEIQEAIKRPAQRFLRRQMTEAHRLAEEHELPSPDEREWPNAITFDDEVVERLLSDADQVIARAEHADHLPLLQHLLYWIWRCAVERNAGMPFPDRITMDDLRGAVLANVDDTGTLSDSINVLESCLENRCQSIFDDNPQRHADWEKAFRSLAFKDPNTGTYTQKRASMEELRGCLRLSSVDALNAYLLPWMDPHRYLFWDEESRTVKVTHESLIRRWESFRKWVDDEDRRFQVYQKLLEECVLWNQRGRKLEDLSSGANLRRFEDFDFREALKDDGARKRFNELLRLDRDRDRLEGGTDYAFEFLEKSLENRNREEQTARLQADRLAAAERGKEMAKAQADRAKAERERAKADAARQTAENELRKRKNRSLWVAIVIIVFVSFFLFSYWQLAKKSEALLRAYASTAETQSSLAINGGYFETWDGPGLPLWDYLAAGSNQSKVSKMPVPPADWPVFSTLFERQLAEIEKVSLGTEIRVIEAIRNLLLTYVWRAPKHYEGESLPAPNWIECKGVSMDEFSNGATARFYPGHQRRGYGLVAVKSSVGGGTQLLWGRMEGATCATDMSQQIVRASAAARVGFDAYLSNIVIAEPRSTSFYSVSWPLEAPPTEKTPIPSFPRPPMRFTMPLDASDDWPVFLTTTPQFFAHDVKIGSEWYRFFEPDPRLLDASPKDGTSLSGNAADEICAALRLNFTPGPDDQMVELTFKDEDGVSTQAVCLRVRKQDAANAYFGEIYRVNKADQHHASRAIALPLVGNLRFGEKTPVKVDMDADYVRFTSGDQWFEQPWSWHAWETLAEQGVRKYPAKIQASPNEREQFKRAATLLGRLRDGVDDGESVDEETTKTDPPSK